MQITVTRFDIEGPLKLTGRRFGDNRGWFAETYSQADMAAVGITNTFVQDNHSQSVPRGTVRGMHYQLPPHAQAKLIQALRGRVLSVAVDIRRSSPTFGQHVAVELSADTPDHFYIPAGFAHGFCTLEDNAEIFYKVDAYYAPAQERGILWHDPALGIAWPVDPAAAVISPKDGLHPPLAQQPDLFP